MQRIRELSKEEGGCISRGGGFEDGRAFQGPYVFSKTVGNPWERRRKGLRDKGKASGFGGRASKGNGYHRPWGH
jgi:hypothetical protein